MSLEVANLNLAYGARQVLYDGSLSLKTGQVIALLGPNGCGKTTLLSALVGFISPQSGSIRYDGQDIDALSHTERARLVGFVPQSLQAAFDFSVLEYVVTGCAPSLGLLQRPKAHHYDLAWEALEQLGITKLADRSYRQISGGEQQQAAIARVLVQRPRYILMDEPTSHLDLSKQSCVLRSICSLAKQGFGILFSTHSPDHAFLIDDQVAVINSRGELNTGFCQNLLQESYLQELYQELLLVRNVPDADRIVCYLPSLERNKI